MADLYDDENGGRRPLWDFLPDAAAAAKERAAMRAEFTRNMGVPLSAPQYEYLNKIYESGAVKVDDVYNMASAVRISNMFNVTPDQAYLNLEGYRAAMFADDEQYQSPKSMAQGFADSWRIGQISGEMSKLGNLYMEAEKKGDEDEIKRILSAYGSLLEENEDLSRFMPKGKWFLPRAINAIGRTALQSAPFSLKTGAAQIAGNITGGVIGGAVGSAVPGAGTAAGAKIGARILGNAAAFAVSANDMKGLIYLQQRFAGVNRENAEALATLAGAADGIVELFLGNVASFGQGALKAALPKHFAVKAAAAAASKNFFKRLASGGLAKSAAGKIIVSETGRILGEGAEEAVQELTDSLSLSLAQVLQDEYVDAKTAGGIVSAAFDSFKGGVLGAIGLGLPNAVVNVTASVREVGAIRELAAATPSKEAFLNEAEKKKGADGKPVADRETLSTVYDNESNKRKKLLAPIREGVENLLYTGADAEEIDAEGVRGEADDSGRVLSKRAVEKDGGRFFDGVTPVDGKENAPGVYSYEKKYFNGRDGKKVFAAITFDEDTNTDTINITSFKTAELRDALRSDVFRQFAGDYKRQKITWDNPGTKAETALWDDMRLNIGGDAGGDLQGGGADGGAGGSIDEAANAGNAEKTVIGAASMYNPPALSRKQQIRLAKLMPQMRPEERPAAVHIAAIMAADLGLTVDEWLENIALTNDGAALKRHRAATFDRWFVEEGDGFQSADEKLESLGITKEEALERDFAALNAGEKGAQWMERLGEEARAVVYVSEKGDFSTWIHELAHVYRRQISGARLKNLEALYGVQNGKWTAVQEEAFAGDVETYMTRGEAPTEAHKSLFEQIKAFMLAVYGVVRHTLRPEVRAELDRIFGGEPLTRDAAAAKTSPQSAEDAPGSTRNGKRGNDTAGADAAPLSGGIEDDGLFQSGNPVDALMARTRTIPDAAERERVRAELRALEKLYPPEANKYPAPNGKPSKLTHEQWYAVRTPSFKNWFGDWEKLAAKEFLEGEAIVNLSGDEFKPDGGKLSEKVLAWYKSRGETTILTPHIGNVLVDERAIHSDIGHGLNREKATAFAAVPDVLRNGTLLYAGTIAEHKNLVGYIFGAPIQIKNEPYVMAALVRTDKTTQRLYVHEVALRSKVQASAFKTEALTTPEDALNGANAGTIKRVFKDIYSVKPSEASAVRDEETGEPLVVYRGSPEKLGDVFEYGKNFYGGNKGFWFTGARTAAESYMFNDVTGDTGEIKEVWLNIRKPLDLRPLKARTTSRKFFEFIREKTDADLGRGSNKEFPTSELYEKYQNNIYSLGGYDGTFLVDKGFHAFIAKLPNQVKSATGNAGTFSGDNDSILFQSAYHGSRALFDKFSADYIGEGEGSQAYGYGLYFAGKKEVSEFYAKTLSKDSNGHLYKASIPDDDEMLDWDKPLQEQPEKVQAAIKSIEFLPPEWARKNKNLGDKPLSELIGYLFEDNTTLGKHFYDYLKYAAPNIDSLYSIENRLFNRTPPDKAASMLLKQYGIKGIRYLDKESRTGGKGTHNYVIFDDSDVYIEETLFQPAMMSTAGQNADNTGMNETKGLFERLGEIKKAETVRLREARIEGIKGIEPKTYTPRNIGKREAKDIFQRYENVEKSFVTDFFESADKDKQPRNVRKKADGVRNLTLSVRFTGRSVGHLGVVFNVRKPSIIADTRQIFEDSLYGYSSNYIVKKSRPDGSIHKEHSDVEAYHHFINKVIVDGQPYYIRFTVEEERKLKGRLHAAHISAIEVINEKDRNAALTLLGKNQGEKATTASDKNLAEFMNSVKSFEAGVPPDGKAPAKGSSGLIPPSPDETLLLQLTEDELYEEALKYESAEAWREADADEALFGNAEKTALPDYVDGADAKIWYETAWDWARKRREREEAASAVPDWVTEGAEEAAPPEGADAAEYDAAWIKRELEQDGRLEEFMVEALKYDGGEARQPYDAEEEAAQRVFLERQAAVRRVLRHASWLSNAKRLAGGDALTVPTRRRLVTLMKESPRDYRALWADIMEQPEWAASYEDGTAAALKRRLREVYAAAAPPKDTDADVNAETDVDALSPEKLRALARTIEDDEIRREAESGALFTDNAKLERYIKLLKGDEKKARKKLERLEGDVDEWLKELSDELSRELRKQFDEMLELKAAAKLAEITTAELEKKGIKATSKYRTEASRKRHDAAAVYEKVKQTLRNAGLEGDVKEALALQDARFRIREELSATQKNLRKLRSIRETKVKLVKRIQRTFSLNIVNYEQAELLTALQQMTLPAMARGVNRWIGTEGSLLKTVYDRFNTDGIFRERLRRGIIRQITNKAGMPTGEISKRSEQRWEKIEGIMGLDYEKIHVKERRYLLEALPLQKLALEDEDVLKNYYALYRSDADFRRRQGNFISKEIWENKKYGELSVEEKTAVAAGIPDEDWARLLNWDETYEERKLLLPLEINEVRDESGELVDVELGEEIRGKLRRALPADLWRRIHARAFAEWTPEEAAELNAEVDKLYQAGKAELARKREEERLLWKSYREKLLETVRTAGINVDGPESEEGKKKIRAILKKYNEGMTGAEARIKKRLIPKFFLNNARRVFREFDGDDDNGIFTTLLIWLEDEVFNKEMRERYRRLEKVNGAVSAAGVDIYELYSNKFKFENFYEDGGGVEIALDAALHVLAAGENERSRMAVMYGSMLTADERNKAYDLPEGDPAIEGCANLGMGRYLRIKGAVEEFLLKEENKKFNAVKEAIMRDYDEQQPRMNEMSIRVYNRPVFKEDNYTPINRTQGTGELPESKLAAEARAAAGSGVRAYHDSGAFKNRIDIGLPYQTPIQLGLYRTWVDNVVTNEHAIAVGEYEKTLNNVFAGKDPGTQAVRKAVADRYGMEAVKFIEDHIKAVIKPDPVHKETAFEKLLPFFRGNTALAYLAFNLQPVLTQAVTSPAPFFQYMAPAEYLAAAKEYMADRKAMDAFIDGKSMHMKARQANLMTAAVREATEKAESRAKAKYNEVVRAGMLGLELVDRTAVAPGWLAVYRREAARLIEENKSAAGPLTESEIDAEAVRLADMVVRDTQPSGRKIDLPHLFHTNNKVVMAFLQFQSSLSTVYQNVFVDAPYFKRTKQYGKIAAGLTSYAASSLILGLLLSGFDDDDDDEEKIRKAAYYAVEQFIGSVPVLGGLITNMAEGVITGHISHRYNFNVFPVADKISNALMAGVSAVNAEDAEKRKKAVLRAVKNIFEAGGVAAGFPVSATKKAADMFGIGDGDGEAGFNPFALFGIGGE